MLFWFNRKSAGPSWERFRRGRERNGLGKRDEIAQIRETTCEKIEKTFLELAKGFWRVNMIEVDYLDNVIVESTTGKGNHCDLNSVLLILTFNTLLIF